MLDILEDFNAGVEHGIHDIGEIRPEHIIPPHPEEPEPYQGNLEQNVEPPYAMDDDYGFMEPLDEYAYEEIEGVGGQGFEGLPQEPIAEPYERVPFLPAPPEPAVHVVPMAVEQLPRPEELVLHDVHPEVEEEFPAQVVIEHQEDAGIPDNGTFLFSQLMFFISFLCRLDCSD